MKRIKSEEDVEIWHQSTAFKNLQNYLDKLFSSVKGIKLSEIKSIENINSVESVEIVKLLDRIERDGVNTIEPIQQQNGKCGRYGNVAFRNLIDKIELIAREELENINNEPNSKEFLVKLLLNSFGDRTRIDYGTGHELNFIIFTMCFLETNVNVDVNYGYVAGIVIGERYLNLVRLIQTKYSLEPAGSHGVWGLDDHQFIPFLLGSSQLIGKEETEEEEGAILTPAALIDPKIFSLEQVRREYLYPAALYHIHQLKTRSNPSLQFHHHSPLLYDISGIPTWQRIHDGLKRMYMKEVLSKFPVVQHILFDEQLFPYFK